MSVVVLLARIVLAAVFAVAAVGKLRDGAGTRRALRDFGAPQRTTGALALVLPAAEITAAALLLVDATVVAGALLALVLLAVFSLAVARVLARGEAPDCHCFGQISSEPASWRTLARNAVLAALAVLVVIAGPQEGWGAIDSGALPWLLGGVALLLVAGVAAWALVSAIRSHGRLLLRVERLEAALAEGFAAHDPDDDPLAGFAVDHHEPPVPASAFSAPAATGGEITLDGLLAPGLPLLMLFTSADCEPCRELLPDVATWQGEHDGVLTIALAASGDATQVRAEAQRLGLANVLLDGEREVADRFGSPATPGAGLVTADGLRIPFVAQGRDDVERLLDAALALERPPGLPVGAELAPVALTTLDGTEVALDHPGAETVVLFWNPGCGYCRDLHDDVIAWERERSPDAPELVIVATDGSDEALREEGFDAPLARDTGRAVAELFDAHGTPMAVRIDAQGRVGSPLAAGADQVLELLVGGATGTAAT